MQGLDFSYIGSLLLSSDFWNASLTVVALSVLSWTMAVVLGMFVALAQQSPRRLLRWVASTYVWFFRSLPLLVLLILVYNMPQMAPALGPVLSQPFLAGLVALVISETAYIAEIHRGGLMGVAKGQHEAGRALGLGPFRRLTKIVAPQALRISLPSLGNEFITIVKMTSLVSVISLTEILLVGQRLYTQNFKVIDTLIAVAIYYVMIVSVFTLLLGVLERSLNVDRKKGEFIAWPEQEAEAAAPASGARPPKHTRPDDAAIMLELRNLQKSFGIKQVLKGVDLSVHEGEVISIIGPSGSGKTTLIRTINGLESIDGGSIHFGGSEWISAEGGGYRLSPRFHAHVTEMGMVFQSFNLFPHMSVLQNVTLGPRCHKTGSLAEIETEALEALRRVGMAEHAQKYPHQLSGGQQQRVAIARALAMKPRVMLFDEPTSALDPELVNEVLGVIERLAREGTTMLIVTHEMRFALNISDRIVFMENGSVGAVATPAEMRSADPDSRVARFLSHH